MLRFDDGRTGAPGPTAFGRPDLDASFERRDLLASGTLRRVGARLGQELRIGFARTRQLSLDPLDSGAWTPEWRGQAGGYELSDYVQPEGYQNRSERRAGLVPARAAARRAAAADRGRGGGARDGRDRRPLAAAAAAGADEPGRLRPGPRAARQPRLPHGRSAGRAERQLRNARRPAGGARPAPARRRGRDDAARERGHGHQGAELPRVVRRVAVRARQPRPRPRAQHDLRPRDRAAALRLAPARHA